MMWLPDHFPHLAAGTVTALYTADKYLAAAKHLIPNSAWQLAKAILTRSPVRASEGEADVKLAFLDDLKNFTEQTEHFGGRLVAAANQIAQAVEVLAPIAERISPLCGSAAPAVAAGAELAEALAPIVEKATHTDAPPAA